MDIDLETFDPVYFVILALFLAFGALQVTGAATGSDKPVVTVISESMCPEIQVGDILFVQGVSYDQVSEGDIVVYNVPDRVEFSIDGEEFVLEEGGNRTVETSAGKLELLDVIPRRDRSRDAVRMTLDGNILESSRGAYLEEGESYGINGNTLRVEYATDLPRGDVPVVHRLVKKNPEYFETKGDANEGQIEFEKHVEPEQLIGKVFFRVPRLGLVKILAMDFIGFSGDRPFVIDNTPSC